MELATEADSRLLQTASAMIYPRSTANRSAAVIANANAA